MTDGSSHRHLPPLCIADRTWLVRRWDRADGAATGVQTASLVIGGAEPVLVDVGPRHDDLWLRDVAAIVDLECVRWLVLTHDDDDHIGGLEAALARCPSATLVTTSALREQRLLDASTARWALFEPGVRLALADRELLAIRPPVVDAPDTIGVLDTATGVYWAADSFGMRSARPVDFLDDIPATTWLDGMRDHHRERCPWLSDIGHRARAASIERVRRSDPRVLASAHGPAVDGRRVAVALAALRPVAQKPA